CSQPTKAAIARTNTKRFATVSLKFFKSISESITLRFKEIQRPSRFPTGWLPQDSARLVPNVLGNHRLFRRIPAFQSRRLHKPHHQPIVMTAKVILRASSVSDVELAAIESVLFALLQKLLHGIGLLFHRSE